MSDDISTPEGPGAGAAEAPAAPAPDAPAQPVPEQGAAELDIASLPEQAQEYIKELREEAKGYRKTYEPFKKAFQHYNESEQQYLLNMVDVLGTDQDAGAQAMLTLSQQLLGIEQAGEAAAVDPEVQQAAEDMNLTPEAIRQIIREEQQADRQKVEEDALIAEVEAEAREIGLEPGSEDYYKVLNVAVAMEEEDLAKVAGMLGLAKTAQPEPAPEPEPEPASEYPVTASVSQGTAGVNAEERQPPPPIGSDALRERVLRRINASDQPG